MGILITITIIGNGQNSHAEFEVEPSSTMDEVVALASSLAPVPDPPFIVKYGPAIVFDTSEPTTGYFTLSSLGITRPATFTLIPAKLYSQLSQQPQQRQQQSTQSVSPLPPPQNGGRNITADDIIRATQQQPYPHHQHQQQKQMGVTTDDVIKAFKSSSRPQAQQFNSQSPQGKKPSADDVILLVKSRPDLLDNISRTMPPLADAILTGKKEIVQKYLDMANEQEDLRRRARENPMDVEVQRKIEEQIRENNIHKNFEKTLNENPELLLGVNLLYVPCKVNGVDIIGMVDTGAQVTIMSSEVARKCNLGWLIDTKHQSIMKGVGEAKAVGRIYGTQIQFGDIMLQCSITVVDTNIDFIIGCDQLRRHKCVVDLAKNVLRVGSTEVPFLGEKDIPKNNRFGEEDDDDDDDDKPMN